MKSYFEIGGYVLESKYRSDTNIPNRPHRDPVLEIAKAHGVPKSVVLVAAKETEAKTGINPVEFTSETYGRGRRASWAIRTAAALALVDGPLPIGDVLAIGVLGVYAGYEISMSAKYVSGLS